MRKQIHLPNVKREEAHMYEGACMRTQHKTLPGGTGAGRGWIMTKQIEKGRSVLEKTSGVEDAKVDRVENMATPTVTALANTAAKETATMAAPASESATMVTTSTTTLITAPTAGKKII